MEKIRDLARVRDEELDGLATAPAGRALLASVMKAEESPAAERRPVRRWVLAGAFVAAAAAVAVVVPGLTGSATSYANSAIDVKLQDGWYVATIKDPLADHERFAEAFQAVGQDVTIDLVPVEPRYVGQLLRSEGTGPGSVRASSDLVPIDGQPVDCYYHIDKCQIVIRISADSTGSTTYVFGRAAKPGETPENPRDAGGPVVSDSTGGQSGGAN